jgi:hypothetical protein
MQMVLSMGYSVTVSAAEVMMRELYAQLFGRAELAAAIRAAGIAPAQRPTRLLQSDH